MEHLQDNLLNAYERGFIDRYTGKVSHHPPELIINSKDENVLAPMLDALESCESFVISVAFITEGGIASLKTALYELNKRGVRGKIITSTYLNFNKPKVFKELLKIPNLDVKITDQAGFHAKGYIFDNKSYSTMFIGSSNLTDAALKKNYEYNLKLTSLDNGEVIQNFKEQFDSLWENSTKLSEEWVREYESLYVELDHDNKVLHLIENKRPYRYTNNNPKEITPNIMQQEALESLKNLRLTGEKKGLVVSATGTGKTYLSAFDVKQAEPKRVLFIAHREQILHKSLQDYRDLIDLPPEQFGIYSGRAKDRNAKFLFATVQTLSRQNHLYQFNHDDFDYIIIDEAHRSGAETYNKIMNYFNPDFMLGMTATPERTDNTEIFSLFDYNIAYEIRLQKALEAEILSPFHYFGVTDLEHNGKTISEDSVLTELIHEDRIDHIIDKLYYYSHAGEKVRGLMFVSNRKEAKKLSDLLNDKGYKTKSLTGLDAQEDREEAVRQLENNRLDYLITVDIFNEGVDIPSVNQVVMLRQTESSIIFVQQLGRGLRKHPGKEFLTVIDFIGNYKNNYLIPVALTGDKSFNKDIMRRNMMNRNMISGESTINFERIAQDRIFKSISNNRASDLVNLRRMYFYTKDKLGHIPSLVDLHNDQDAMSPMLVLNKFNHYPEFLGKMKEEIDSLTNGQDRILTFLSKEIVDGKRVQEVFLLKELLSKGTVNKPDFQLDIYEKGYYMTDETMDSILRMMTLEFYTSASVKKYKYPLIEVEDSQISLSKEFKDALKDDYYEMFINDLLNLAELQSEQYNQQKPLTLNEKYSRKDVCRVMNWEKDESSTMYGYKNKHNTVPIFINYNKSKNIDESVKYNDKFLDSHVFQWFTRKGTDLNSKINREIIRDYKNDDVTLYLFVKKDEEEVEHYYLGEVEIDLNSAENVKDGIGNNRDKVAKMNFILENPVEYGIFRYFESLT
ncbi:DUF3427 domain-containing protein [Lacicoccus qingdaonensis]|uniref:Superfamily II DNA or RNA helicase n=1 Tax=Lacicoccus qingdaonensis TaxID=576118 RepID=A0A1G9EIC9_9BACL|nr:DEAD/DEAH box helicase [Salinicoccus qingdaonensis]SDK75785.1 Superfamily II DNA or RNA helicase [Salinicoccus qingdaonensis]